MPNERDRVGKDDEPFRQSESGESYNPQGNWGAERRGRGATRGDGGFGPEGDYAGAAGDPNAEVLGEVDADPDRLVDEAHEVEQERQRRRENS